MDEKMSIMIVDDEMIVRESLLQWFEKYGHEVDAAASGLEALEKLERFPFELLFVDIKMPGMDGIEAGRVLTEERISPVLLLTAYSQHDLVERAKDAGVMAYIVKPFHEADLAPAIEVALRRWQEFRSLEKEVEDLKEALETRKLVDRAKGILMDTQGLSEADAFRRIQKTSMDQRKPMKEVAEAIVLAHEAGKGE